MAIGVEVTSLHHPSHRVLMSFGRPGMHWAFAGTTGEVKVPISTNSARAEIISATPVSLRRDPNTHMVSPADTSRKTL
jgi:hypothetical protein